MHEWGFNLIHLLSQQKRVDLTTLGNSKAYKYNNKLMRGLNNEKKLISSSNINKLLCVSPVC